VDKQSIKNILKILSLVGMGLSFLFLLPIFIGVHYKEHFFDFLVFDAGFFLLNFLFYLVVRNHEVALSIK